MLVALQIKTNHTCQLSRFCRESTDFNLFFRHAFNLNFSDFYADPQIPLHLFAQKTDRVTNV